MARKKKSKKTDSDKEREIQKLIDRKLEISKNLAILFVLYNNLSNAEIKSPEDWIYGFPIESIKHLSSSKRRTRLGDVRARADIKKSSLGIVIELEQIDKQIRGLRLDLISEKIETTLKESENIPK